MGGLMQSSQTLSEKLWSVFRTGPTPPRGNPSDLGLTPPQIDALCVVLDSYLDGENAAKLTPRQAAALLIALHPYL